MRPAFSYLPGSARRSPLSFGTTADGHAAYDTTRERAALESLALDEGEAVPAPLPEVVVTEPTKVDVEPLVCRPERRRVRRTLLPRKNSDLGDVLVGVLVGLISVGGFLVVVAVA